MGRFKTLKSATAILLASCIGYFTPLSAFASFDIRNDNYNGKYKNLANSKSYISAEASGCSVNVVYSDLQNTYVTAKNGEGYISNKRFYAEFGSYSITKVDGTVVRNYNSETYFSGSVSTETGEKYIYTGGRYYYKK
ncbi:hypothetical protein [Ruminococcus bicirculans (ex Wegman et al. 2014)]|jgi:hypothetical protein|nr:hypothetical protein [Ruminococcus bicirculans (ex Wegman et al. 2014)]RGG21901.1 hypothetical protein DWY44_08615 [Ruminococcus sp. AF25-19]